MLRSICKSCLPRVVRSVAGAIHHDGKPVAHRILDEILNGNCCVLLQPVFPCEPFEGTGEFVIDLGPCSPKFGFREWIAKHAVRIRHIRQRFSGHERFPFYIVYPSRKHLPAKTLAFVDFVVALPSSSAQDSLTVRKVIQ